MITLTTLLVAFLLISFVSGLACISACIIAGETDENRHERVATSQHRTPDRAVGKVTPASFRAAHYRQIKA